MKLCCNGMKSNVNGKGHTLMIRWVKVYVLMRRTQVSMVK